MGRGPKRKSTKNRIQPRQATQRSHHSLVDRENLSPLLTSINWWSSQREEPHTRQSK